MADLKDPMKVIVTLVPSDNGFKVGASLVFKVAEKTLSEGPRSLDDFLNLIQLIEKDAEEIVSTELPKNKRFKMLNKTKNYGVYIELEYTKSIEDADINAKIISVEELKNG